MATIPDRSVVLGERYRDSITGFEGVAVSSATYLYGCIRVQLERADKDGKSESDYFDEQRLVLVPAGDPVATTATSGGPGDAPPARAIPSAREAH